MFSSHLIHSLVFGVILLMIVGSTLWIIYQVALMNRPVSQETGGEVLSTYEERAQKLGFFETQQLQNVLEVAEENEYDRKVACMAAVLFSDCLKARHSGNGDPLPGIVVSYYNSANEVHSDTVRAVLDQYDSKDRNILLSELAV